jgi:predicted PurR-regulated permease PerM
MSTLTTHKIVTGILVVLSVFVFFMLLNHFREEMILVFAGIVISISMAPAVDWLHQKKLPRSISVMLIYAGLLALLVGFIFLVIPQTLQQGTALAPRVESMYKSAISYLQSSPYLFLRQWGSNLPPNLGSLVAPSSPGTGNTALNSISWTLNIAQSVLDGLFTLSIVLLIAFYWTLEGERAEYAFLLLLRGEKRESTYQIIKDIESRVGGFVRGEGLLACAIGGMALIAYFIIGLPSVLSLAFLAAVGELIPVFGPTLGAIPALLVALDGNPTKILWVILATISIQFFENHFLAPRIMQKTVGVNPIVTILSIIGFGSLFGFPGLLMAIPLAATAQVILARLILDPAGPSLEAPTGRDRVSKLSYELQEFVQDVRKRVRLKEAGSADGDSDDVEDAIEAIATDLDGILAQNIQPDNPQ